MLKFKLFGLLAFLLANNLLASQVTIIVRSIAANTPAGANIFIAGSFNSWDPANPAFQLLLNSNGHHQIVINATGSIGFKFTRGSWATVEGNANGGFLPNRSFVMGSADTLQINILSWEDIGGSNSTAAQNVTIMSTSFLMPQFNRTRRIWIYRPPNYETSGIRYPVLYMHDGQNLFDQATSFSGEWQVDETLNALFNQGKPVPIVVGIDNGAGNRIAEYTPWAHTQHGGGDGELYARFIEETLKPFVDQNYRTLPGREYTGVMGSSLGGLISFYIAQKHQNVFSKAGVFSPSFWFSDSVYVFASQTPKEQPMRLYMMAGSNESHTMVGHLQSMADTLGKAGYNDSEVKMVVIAGGQHNEALWRSQFGQAYEWLYLSGTTNLPRELPHQNIRLRQGLNWIWIEQDVKYEGCQFALQVFNLNGQKVFGDIITPGQKVMMPAGLKGIFVARIIDSGWQFTQKIVIP